MEPDLTHMASVGLAMPGRVVVGRSSGPIRRFPPGGRYHIIWDGFRSNQRRARRQTASAGLYAARRSGGAGKTSGNDGFGVEAMYSILHITDLHRAKNDPISNAELLSALVADRENYKCEDPPVRAPDAIVVSGDLIQGVGLHTSDFEQALAAQYNVAHEFLVGLTQRFLDGDRSRVVIVPGNHDMDWNLAVQAMEVVPESELPKNLPRALYEPDSVYRWDWSTRQLYRIKDVAAYGRRLAAFWAFFDRFYEGSEKMLRVRSWSDANLYSLDEGRIGVAAFNSCSGNDCFAFQGAIPRDVVAQAHLDLKDLGPWRLRVAVWHHDVEGPPHRADYMDVDIIRGMIGRGFRLGLYGHQHRLQITPQHAHLLTDETMAIASAGSLCAGRAELPLGAVRGYSLVEVRDDYKSARVHVREMRVANFFTRAVLQEFGGSSYVDLQWTTPVDAAGRPEDPIGETRSRALRAAENALRGTGDARAALDLLATVEIGQDAFARQLLIDAVQSLNDPAETVALLSAPQSIGELVLLIDSHLALRDGQRAIDLLAVHKTQLNLPIALSDELERKIKLTSWNRDDPNVH